MKSLIAMAVLLGPAAQDEIKPGLIGFPSTTGDLADTGLFDSFYVRWSDILRIPAEGTYTFYLVSDDGSRLFIDCKKVVDNGGPHTLLGGRRARPPDHPRLGTVPKEDRGNDPHAGQDHEVKRVY